MAKKKSRAARPDSAQTEAGMPAAEAVPEDAPENAIEAVLAAEETAAAVDAVPSSEGDEPGGLDESVADVAAEEEESEIPPEAGPPTKLDRLQKILAQAGVASRRRAEELIREGRVQVNGQIVTTLGTKADAGRDHIRVDGKLLHGAERHRYFVLNKPKGYVTTVSDPEGRPTVMQFFSKMRERLYPVGRLDYMSEGLLLVTNDGELANRLTRAASGVEKTYLVKVSGQPTQAELELLRGGVGIERGQPGSERVVTGPARIRQVRVADNPWFEVVLTEGRNRELRKMFEQTGHFVEKIRRVGYGPLVLDQEPGKFRELEPEELEALRRAAEGKPPATKTGRGRQRERALDASYLPTVSPRSGTWQQQTKAGSGRSGGERRVGRGRFGAKRPFAAGRAERPAARPGQTGGDWPARKKASRPAGGSDGAKPFGGRSYGKQTGTKRGFHGEDLTGGTSSGKPAKPGWKKRAGSTPPFKRESSAPRGEGAAGTRPERASSGGGRGRSGIKSKVGGYRATGPRPGGTRPGGSRRGGPRAGGKLLSPKRPGGKRPGNRKRG